MINQFEFFINHSPTFCLMNRDLASSTSPTIAFVSDLFRLASKPASAFTVCPVTSISLYILNSMNLDEVVKDAVTTFLPCWMTHALWSADLVDAVKTVNGSSYWQTVDPLPQVIDSYSEWDMFQLAQFAYRDTMCIWALNIFLSNLERLVSSTFDSFSFICLLDTRIVLGALPSSITKTIRRRFAIVLRFRQTSARNVSA